MKTFFSFIPSFVRPLATLFLGTLAVFLLARVIMLTLVWDSVMSEPPEDVLKAFYIGIKFDMRMAVFGLIPLGLFLVVPCLEYTLAEKKNRPARYGFAIRHRLFFHFAHLCH